MDEPKKYIRTFAGDFETLKKGGTPDLAPLRRAVAPVPIKPTVAEPSPVKMPEAPSPDTLKTYSGDFAERMKETKASTATVLAAEQDSAPILIRSSPQKISGSSIVYSIAGVLLLIGGGVGAYIAYHTYLSSSAPVVIAPTVSAPIFVDEREAISGIGTALLQEIQQSVTRSLASGTIRLLYLEGATSTSVFSALQLPAPGALLRNIHPARSMAGVVNTGSGVQSPLFILSVTSYSDTFAALLQWEPLMPRDLAKLFPPHQVSVSESAATTTAATVSTSSPQATPPKKSTTTVTTTPPAPAFVAGFFDATVANHDVRVYRDTSGRDIVLYGYWNQTTLIIARDTAAFTEIVGRLATSRTQ